MVSVIIPTRNRQECLFILLNDLSRQAYPLEEVIVVDASDEPLDGKYLQQQFPLLNIVYIVSEPSVCKQRNIGIREAKGSFVFLCDDDIGLPSDYVAILIEHIKNKEVGAVSGLILQKDNDGAWVGQYPPRTFRHLLFSFIFQQSVWGEVNDLKVNPLVKPLYSCIKAFYRSRKNTLSLAGWPIITNFASPVFMATVYGLGASVVKKEWLSGSSFEEVLDAHGIGDNYGVAIGLPQQILVIKGAKAYHHQSTGNRLEQSVAYFRRILALHYFLKTRGRFRWWNRLWFCWSLLGNMVFHRNKKYRKASGAALRLIVSGKNPYLQAS